MVDIDKQSRVIGELSARMDALTEGQRDMWAALRGLHETVLRMNTTVDELAHAMKDIEPIVKTYSRVRGQVMGVVSVLSIVIAVVLFTNERFSTIFKAFIK